MTKLRTKDESVNLRHNVNKMIMRASLLHQEASGYYCTYNQKDVNRTNIQHRIIYKQNKI